MMHLGREKCHRTLFFSLFHVFEGGARGREGEKNEEEDGRDDVSCIFAPQPKRKNYWKENRFSSGDKRENTSKIEK